MSQTPVKAVFFDAADTLFYVKGGVAALYRQVAAEYGSNASPAEIKTAFGRAFASAPPLAFGGVSDAERKGLERQWWYDVVRRVFDEVGIFPQFNAYFDELFETFRVRAWELFPETKTSLASLKARGFRLGLVSNFDSRVYDVCANLGIYGYFDSFVISSEAGFAKPSPEIFAIALERNAVSRGECVHVGDSLKFDYVGARAFGIRAYLLDRDGQYKNSDGVQRIDTLAELESLL
ncbi:MAG: HAD-IA family hydrolase [Deltaproteobacteria bacterium]